MAKFQVGDKVQKMSGYKYPGIVVCVFLTTKKELRCVVEADSKEFRHMLDIFDPGQLELREEADLSVLDNDVLAARLRKGAHLLEPMIGVSAERGQTYRDLIREVARRFEQLSKPPTVEGLEALLKEEPDDGAIVGVDGHVTRPKMRREPPGYLPRGDTPLHWVENAPSPQQYNEPWTISKQRGIKLPAIVQSTLYDFHHRDYWKLVPALTAESKLEVSRTTDGLPHNDDRLMLRATVNLYDKVDGWYVLRVAEAPAEDRELWPRLRRENNHAEYVDLPEWQQKLYERNEQAAKWVLREEHRAWAGE